MGGKKTEIVRQIVGYIMKALKSPCLVHSLFSLLLLRRQAPLPMSHCVICFDDGTPENPLIKPCRTCNLEIHNDCVLNLVSTHIIAKRAAYKSHLFPTHTNPHVLASFDGTLLQDSYFRALIMNTPFDGTESHYFKYFKRGAIISKPPKVGLQSNLDTILMRDLVNPMVYIHDVCPQCHRVLSFVSPINSLVPFGSVFNCKILSAFESFTTKIKAVYSITKMLTPHLLCEYGEGLVCAVSVIFPLVPWIILGRNIQEYKIEFLGTDGISEVLGLSDLLSLSSYMLTSINLFSCIRLVWLGSNAANTLPSFLRFLALFVKHAGDLIYSATFNICYLNWAIETNPQTVVKYVNRGTNATVDADSIKQLSFKDKFLCCTLVDFRKVFIRTWDPSFGEDILGTTKIASFDAPFDSIFHTFLGIGVGHKIIGKYKPMVRFIYKAVRRYRPVPIEIELCFEYLGFQSVLLAKVLYEFLYVYSEHKSILSYRVLRTVHE